MNIGCVIAAGSPSDKVDAVAEYTGAVCKAMVLIKGKHLIEFVGEAVRRTNRIAITTVVGCPELEALALNYGFSWVHEQGGMLDNFLIGAGHIFQQQPKIDRVIIAMADIPLLKPMHLDWFIDECEKTDHDFYWAIIHRQIMTQRFPESRRTYARTKEGSYCSGDLLLIRRAAFESFVTRAEYWKWAIQNRKRVWPMLLRFGIGSWLRFLTGKMSLSDIENTLQKVLEIRVRAVVSPHAEHGMDVDKPFQLRIAERELDLIAQ